MILLRLDGIKGKFCDIVGGQEKYQYGHENVGWFPIESMNFGFQSVTEAAANGTPGSGQTPVANAGQPATQPASKVPPAKGGKAGGESFTTISVNKFVDGTTTTLMRFAMEDRKVTKADEKKMRKADFHFLHSVMGRQSDAKPGRFIFPYMMLTLENVLIRGWNITAAGDDRPAETLELWYDKAAMRYYRTKDGLVWTGGDVSGWDQSKNEQWTPPDKGTFFEHADTTR
jgi:type VI protein secretion system component Hcp